MCAATQGGVAFANASVTLIHGMSRPIGAHYHVPHGMSNAMLLPAVTAWSVSGAPDRYAVAARHMGFADAESCDEAACQSLVHGLRTLGSSQKRHGARALGLHTYSFKVLGHEAVLPLGSNLDLYL